MKKWVKGAWAAATITVVTAGIGMTTLSTNPRAQVLTGYTAIAACNQKYTFVNGDHNYDLPDHRFSKTISVEYDTFHSSATASIAGTQKQTAFYTPGYGCTLSTNQPQLPTTIPDIDSRVTRGGGVPQPDSPYQGLAAQAMEDLLEDTFNISGTRGMVVMVDGALVAEAYASGYSKDKIQAGWGMTQAATNLMAGRINYGAVEGVSLSSQSNHLLPEWQKGEQSEITLGQLLRMTSGLNWTERYDTHGDTSAMLYRNTPASSYIANKGIDHAPGTVWQYNSGSPIAACSALQYKTGMGADLAYKTLFQPLGMASALLSADSSGTMNCATGMVATPRDWAKMGQFILNNGLVSSEDPHSRLVSSEWIQSSLQPSDVPVSESSFGGTDQRHPLFDQSPTSYLPTPSSPEEIPEGQPQYASGWWTNRSQNGQLFYPELPADMVWARGIYGQYLILIPSRNMVLVRMGFTPGGNFEFDGMARAVQGSLFIDDLSKGTVPPHILSTISPRNDGIWSDTLRPGATTEDRILIPGVPEDQQPDTIDTAPPAVLPEGMEAPTSTVQNPTELE